MESAAWTLNTTDWKKWGKNLLVFLLPLLMIYFTTVSSNIQSGFTGWQMFALDATTQGALILYALNAAIDFLKKWATGPIQIVG